MLAEDQFHGMLKNSCEDMNKPLLHRGIDCQAFFYENGF
jgi:hypothetical protein